MRARLRREVAVTKREMDRIQPARLCCACFQIQPARLCCACFVSGNQCFSFDLDVPKCGFGSERLVSCTLEYASPSPS